MAKLQTELSQAERGKKNGIWKYILKDTYMPLAILLLIIITALIQPRFLTVSNITNILQQIAPLAIVTMGQAFALISGGLDLSVGSIIAFAGVMSAYGAIWGGSPVGFALGILAGALLGAINGLIISRFNVSPFVVTLGMMTAASGLTLIVTNGLTIYDLPDSFALFGRGRILAYIPVSIVIAIISLIIGWIILNRTKLGRYIYAVGGNEEASYLAGINIRRIKFYAYLLSGAFAGLAAVVLTSRTGAAQPNAGLNFEVNSIAAAIIGGIFLGGGGGKVSQVVYGFILIGLLTNALNLIGISSYVQLVITGSVIVIAVVIDQFRKKRGERG